jgi:hypothetical protein
MLLHKKCRYALAREQFAISKLSIRQLHIRNEYVHSISALALQILILGLYSTLPFHAAAVSIIRRLRSFFIA